jgi:hypothetical protein
MIVSLVDLKSHLNMTSTSDDDELQLVLDAAERVVEEIAGPRSPDTVTETVTVVGGTAILSRRPTGPVLSGGIAVGGVVDGPAGLVTGLGGNYGLATRRLTVTYPVGSDDVPPEVFMACLIIAAHLWETQRGAAPVGPLSGDDAFPTPGLGFAIPNRALELLAPYRRPAVA